MYRFCSQIRAKSVTHASPSPSGALGLPNFPLDSRCPATDHSRVPPTNDPPTIGLLLSGGIDSAVLLSQLLDDGRAVTPFYVKTGCVWQASELDATQQFLARVARAELADLVVLDLPLDDLYGN